MVHFPGFAPPVYGFNRRRRELTPARFPHSDIPGSKLAYSSPRLFAVSHVLHRLLSPRHPPYALSSLIVRLARSQFPPRSRESAVATGSATRTASGTPSWRAECVRRLPMTFAIRLSKMEPRLARHPWWRSGAEAPRRHQRTVVVGVAGFEPATSSLSGMRSNQLSYTPLGATPFVALRGGADRSRTDDLLNANQALSQLSYSPGRRIGPSRGWLDVSRRLRRRPPVCLPIPNKRVPDGWNRMPLTGPRTAEGLSVQSLLERR